MINKCDSCVHAKTCYGQNDDYADDGGLCVHYRHSSGMNNDEVVMWLKETQEHYGECHEKAYEAIEIAINRIQEPSRSEGDLISREWLKRAFPYTDEWYKSRVVAQVIDNAPTVPLPNEQTAWEQGYEYGYHQAKEDAIRRIAEQYSEHNELIPNWLSIGDMKGGAE